MHQLIFLLLYNKFGLPPYIKLRHNLLKCLQKSFIEWPWTCLLAPKIAILLVNRHASRLHLNDGHTSSILALLLGITLCHVNVSILVISFG